MKIKAYLKPHCGWSNGVRAIMRKYNLAFEDIDIINNRANYEEMVRKSGQPLSPCVEIDGVMLADISGEEVENYLLANNLVKASGASGRRRHQRRLLRRGTRPPAGEAGAVLLRTAGLRVNRPGLFGGRSSDRPFSFWSDRLASRRPAEIALAHR